MARNNGNNNKRRKTGGGRDRDGGGDGGGAKKKESSSSFKSFLKKRAPIYLGLVGLFIVFVVPELTKADLQDSLPELPADQQQIVDALMGYDGPNETGLTLAEAISMKIGEQYPDEKIFNDKRTSVELTVTGLGQDTYNVYLGFESHKGAIDYDWDIDMQSGVIIPNNPDAKHVKELVDFYD